MGLTIERLNIIRAQIEAYEFACREGCWKCRLHEDEDWPNHCNMPDSRARLEALREEWKKGREKFVYVEEK